MWNDRRLVRRAVRGDSDAFAAIFRRYQQDLYRYCVAILGNEQDAQDALQNTMVKALRALPGERRQIELKPWLYRVAHNESIELRRRARPSAPLAAEVPAPDASPEQRAADRGRLQDLLADIGELPERHRGALVMRELGGLDFEQIAAALDTSPGAARQVLHQARRTLQQMSDGREMGCDDVTALLSERDGRVARRRDLRAHLRGCPECRRFAAGIRGRSETLAGIAPLPALAAAAIAKGALSGVASGGAAAGVAGGASTAGGAAGALGGAAAKAASSGAILKSTAAIVAIAGLSGVAVERGHLLHGGRPPASGERGPAVARADAGGPSVGARRAEGAGHAGDGDGPAASPAGITEPRRPAVEKVGLEAPVTGAKALGGDSAGSGAAAPGTSRADAAKALGGDGAGAHPEHPERPGRPDHPTHPEHPDHPAHPEHPDHPTQPDHPDHPTYPDRSAHPEHPSHFADPSASTTSHPEHPSHPQQPGTEAPSDGSDAAVDSHPGPPEHAPHPTPEAEATPPDEGTTVPAEPEITESAPPDGEAPTGESGR